MEVVLEYSGTFYSSECSTHIIYMKVSLQGLSFEHHLIICTTWELFCECYSQNQIFTFRWRGSVYKIVWRELVVYLAMYYALNFVVRFGLNKEQKR